MISRTWHGIVPKDMKDGFEAHLSRTGVKDALELAGNRGAYIHVVEQNERCHFYLCTFWNAWEDVVAYAGDKPGRAITYPEDEAYGLISDPIVIHQTVNTGDNPFAVKHTGTRPIDTNRLLLRRYELTDARDMFFNWVTDAEVTRFWGWSPHKDIEETKRLLMGWIEDYRSPSIYHWVIVHKEIDQAVGYIYLSDIDAESKAAAIHFLVSRTHWNKGIATEACKAVVRYAFDEVGFKTIHTHHHADNPASGRVMQKTGMEFAKEEYRAFPAGDESLSGMYRYYTIHAR